MQNIKTDKLMERTIKALTPVCRAYVSTITETIRLIPETLSVSLDSEGQYDFIFTIEYAAEEDLPGIMEQIKPLLRLYGSIVLSFDEKSTKYL